MYNTLAESLGSGIADEEEVDEEEESANIESDSFEEDKMEDEKIKTIIQSTIEYSIKHDKKELLELMNEFRKDDEFLDTVQELEELADVYLLGEFLKKNRLGSKSMKLEENWKIQLSSN